jgi:glycosyltransferase involved in cell wall biosynthesis
MMKGNKPLVSAVVTTHNRASLLPRALNSVLEQSYPNLELVVVDDGSTDDTEAVVDRYRNHIVLKYLKNAAPEGACSARNSGIREAQGEFVAGLDDDDEWHPERITRLLEINRDDFSCLTSDVRMVYPNRSVVWHKKQVIDLDDLLYSNQVGNQVLVRRERLLDIGGFDEKLEAAQDYDLWVRLCEAYGPVRNVTAPLQLVHQHDEQRITTSSAQFRGYFQFYKKHKAKMTRAQRMYQLFNIRRAQGKVSGVTDILRWVPPRRYWKEFKRLAVEQVLS